MKKIIFIFFLLILFEINVSATNNIKIIDLSVNIPDEYYVFTRDIEEDDFLLEKFNMTKNYISTYMNGLNAYLIAINEDNTENIFITRKSDDTIKGYKDLNFLPTSTLNALADGYRIGLGADKYEIIEYNTKQYIVFEYENEDIYGEYYYILKYKTIVNGYDYTFYLRKLEPINQNDYSTMNNMIESISYENVLANSIVSIITLVLFGGFVAMFFIKLKK